MQTNALGVKYCCGCGPEQICDHCNELRYREVNLWAAVGGRMLCEVPREFEISIHGKPKGYQADVGCGLVRRGFVAEAWVPIGILADGRLCECFTNEPSDGCEQCKGDPDYRVRDVAPGLGRLPGLETVIVTDRVPHRYGTGGHDQSEWRGWLLDGFWPGGRQDDPLRRSALPPAIWHHLAGYFPFEAPPVRPTALKWYPTAADAVAALSAAAIAHCRAAARGEPGPETTFVEIT